MIVPEAARLYATAEVCDWLGVTLAWFYCNHAALKAKGFPAPIPKPGHPRWRGDALLAWSGGQVAERGPNVTILADVARARSLALKRQRKTHSKAS